MKDNVLRTSEFLQQRMHSEQVSLACITPIESNLHPNEYFDRIFVINLRQNRLKLSITTHMLARYGISWEHFDAVNGFDETQVNAWCAYASKGFTHPFEEVLQRKLIESPGAWGTLLSFKRLIEHARREGLRRILVLEDDIMIHKDFLAIFPRAIDELPDDWKLVYFGCRPDDWNRTKEYSTHLYYPGVLDADDYRPLTHGAFAFALDESVYDLALNLIEPMEWPFDSGSLKEINRLYPSHTFAALPHLFIPDISVSSIREPGNNQEWAEASRARPKDYESREISVYADRDPGLPGASSAGVAFVVVDHESEYLKTCLSHLHAQNIASCLIYRKSTPGSISSTMPLEQLGVFCEKTADQGKTTRDLVQFAHALSDSIDADWFVFLFSNEIIEAPRPYISFQEGVQDATFHGFSFVGCEEFVFFPVDYETNGIDAGYFELMRHYVYLDSKHPRAARIWKKQANPLSTIASREVFPTKFRLRRYLLSQRDLPGHVAADHIKKLRDPFDWEWKKDAPLSPW